MYPAPAENRANRKNAGKARSATRRKLQEEWNRRVGGNLDRDERRNVAISVTGAFEGLNELNRLVNSVLNAETRSNLFFD